MKNDLNEIRGKVRLTDYEILMRPNQHPYDSDWWGNHVAKYEDRMRKFPYTKQRKKARYKKALARFFKRYYKEEF